MADPYVLDSQFVRKATLASGVTASVGSLLYWDGSAYDLADASDATKPAELVALEAGDGDATDFSTAVDAAPYAIIADTDAPHTQGALQYLSETAGATTETRPTTAASLRQVVGRSRATDLIEYDISRDEVRVEGILGAVGSGEMTLDSGNFVAQAHVDAQNEIVSYNLTLPENTLSVVKAVVQCAAEASAGTPTANIVIGSAVEGAQHDAVTPDSSLTSVAIEGAAPDEMHDIDISTGFDATDIVRPGAQITVNITKNDAGTDNTAFFDCYVIVKVAD